MRRRHDYDPDSDCAGWEGCAYWKRQYPGAWWNVTNDPIDAEGVGRGEASPLWSFVHSRALNRLALRTKLRILHATGAPATTDGGALVYLKHDAMGPYGEACLLVFNPGAAQAITVDLSPLPSALLAGSTVPTDLLDRSGAERFRGTAAAAAAGGLPSMPPPLAAAWTVPMGAGEVKAFGGFRLGTFAPRTGKRGPCAADDGYALRSNRTTLQGCFLQCLGDARCAHVHVAYVRIVWMESPPPVSCTLLGPMRDARAACSAGTGTLVSKLVGGRPFADVEAERAALSEYRARVLAHGTYDAHALAPEVRTLTSLPTLNATNAAEHPQWHAYVRRLYGPAAAGMLPLDLNTFTWFYWFAPLRLRHILLCDWIDSYAEAPHGTPWTGGLAAWSWGPEHLVRRAGFFVHRRRWADDAYEAAPRLEVMRIGPIPLAGFDEGAQAVWMYHAIGSGVLVRRDSFARLEVRHVRQAAVRPRVELVPTTPCTHPPSYRPLQVRYVRQMAVPRIELVGHLPLTPALGVVTRPSIPVPDDPDGRAAAFWPAAVRYEVQSGEPCDSTSAQRQLLSCANLPVPLWPADDDPTPAYACAGRDETAACTSFECSCLAKPPEPEPPPLPPPPTPPPLPPILPPPTTPPQLPAATTALAVLTPLVLLIALGGAALLVRRRRAKAASGGLVAMASPTATEAPSQRTAEEHVTQMCELNDAARLADAIEPTSP